MEFFFMLKYVFLLLLILTAGCIRIEHRPKANGSKPSPEAVSRGQVVPLPGLQAAGFQRILTMIRQKNIVWEDISRYPAPEQSWREERFRQVRPSGELRPEDFRLAAIPKPNRYVFSFLPLRAAYDGQTVWDTRVVFELDHAGEISDIRMISERIKQTDPGLFKLSASDCNSISYTVLKALFKLNLPKGVRASEKFRFCFPSNGTDKKFHDHLRPRTRIPELDPTEEYPNFPIPFERGRYRSFEHGAFYYYAGIVLPVSSGEAWVFDTAVLYHGGQHRGTCFKLKKKLFLWEIIAEGSCDAPSRAVKEKD